MRQCVSKDGTIDFSAWEALGSDVTSEEFVQLERVALFEADMRWESTDFYREWVKAGEPSVGPAPTNPPNHPIAVQHPQPTGSVASMPMRSTAELTKIVADSIRRSQIQSREAAKEGIERDADHTAWMRSKGYL